MHHVGEALDGVQLFHPDRPEAADLAEVVASEVHQHIVLSQLLAVGEQLRLQGPVLLGGLSPRPGAREREGVQHAVLQLDQRLR